MTCYATGILRIPNATPETTDAAQYMFRRGKKQYNLCGEFCVAFMMQDEAHADNIDSFLDYWEAKDLKWYQTLFHNGIARTTSSYDLTKMIMAYQGVNEPAPLSSVASCAENYVMMLADHQAVVGVQIDRHGYLVGRGIPHWIVLERLHYVDSFHAIADIYNPFTNSMEPYTWRELMTSTGSYKYGLWVER